MLHCIGRVVTKTSWTWRRKFKRNFATFLVANHLRSHLNYSIYPCFEILQARAGAAHIPADEKRVSEEHVVKKHVTDGKIQLII